MTVHPIQRAFVEPTFSGSGGINPRILPSTPTPAEPLPTAETQGERIGVVLASRAINDRQAMLALLVHYLHDSSISVPVRLDLLV